MPDIFDEKNEVKPQTIDWYKVGDQVFGTKVGQRANIKTKFGPNTLYEIKAEGGVYHTKDGEEVAIKKGEIYGVWGRGDIFDGQLNRMQIGQKFGLKFTESKPSSAGNDAKIIKVYTTGEMDNEYLESLAGTGEPQF